MEERGVIVEAAAAAMASIDGMAMAMEDLGLQMRRQWRHIVTVPDGALLQPAFTFFCTLDWTEPGLLVLIAFHIGLFTVAVKSRENNNLQMSLFTFGLLSVYFAEKINSLLGRNWELFSRKPYFDHNEVFVSTMWSGPLLLVLTVVLANTLHTLAKLLVMWKRAKHRAHVARQEVSFN